MRKINLTKYLMPAGGAAAGAAIAMLIDQKVIKNVTFLDKLGKFKGIIYVAFGVALAYLGRKSQILQYLGLGMAGFGGIKLATEFMVPASALDSPATEGIGAMRFFNRGRQNGFKPALLGINDNNGDNQGRPAVGANDLVYGNGYGSY